MFDLRDATFFSLTIDGTIDISAKEQESLYVWSSSAGAVQNKFLGFVEPESTAANESGGTGCDGASNMMGKHRGAGKLLKYSYPDLISIHCLDHRLELAIKNFIKQLGNKLYDKLMTLLDWLYYFKKAAERFAKNQADDGWLAVCHQEWVGPIGCLTPSGPLMGWYKYI